MKLREYRKKKNITLRGMAKLLGLKSQSTVFNYENGRIPPKKVMQKIEEVTSNWVRAQDFYGE
jgi:transcriptional regulator with XRE-family HTH domain